MEKIYLFYSSLGNKVEVSEIQIIKETKTSIIVDSDSNILRVDKISKNSLDEVHQQSYLFCLDKSKGIEIWNNYQKEEMGVLLKKIDNILNFKLI